MHDWRNDQGLKFKLGTFARVAATARDEAWPGEIVQLFAVITVEQRAADPEYRLWRALPSGPLYMAESSEESGGVTLFVLESELEPVS